MKQTKQKLYGAMRWAITLALALLGRWLAPGGSTSVVK